MTLTQEARETGVGKGEDPTYLPHPNITLYKLLRALPIHSRQNSNILRVFEAYVYQVSSAHKLYVSNTIPPNSRTNHHYQGQERSKQGLSKVGNSRVQ